MTYTDYTGVLPFSFLSHIATNWKSPRAILLVVLYIITPCYWHVINNPTKITNTCI